VYGDAGGAEDKQQDCDQFNARQFQVSFIFPGHISLGNLKFLILEGLLLYFFCTCEHLEKCSNICLKALLN